MSNKNGSSNGERWLAMASWSPQLQLDEVAFHPLSGQNGLGPSPQYGQLKLGLKLT